MYSCVNMYMYHKLMCNATIQFIKQTKTLKCLNQLTKFFIKHTDKIQFTQNTVLNPLTSICTGISD